MSIIDLFSYKKKNTCKWCKYYNSNNWTCDNLYQISRDMFIHPDEKVCCNFAGQLSKIKASNRIQINPKGKRITISYLMQQLNELESELIASKLLNKDTTTVEYDIKSIKQTVYYLENLYKL